MRPPDLGERASFDLKCPKEQIKLTKLDDITFGAEGCDRSATYIYNDYKNIWIMNSTAQPAAAGAEAESPASEPPTPDSAESEPPAAE